MQSLEEIWRFAMAVVNSGVYKDVNTPEIAVIKIQAGLELGLTPVWSLSNLMVVNGRVAVWGDALLGIVRAHPQFVDIRETIEGDGDDAVAICEVDRKGQSTVARRFRVKDAKRAGLWGKSGPWSSYPNRMLAMRARSWACRDAFADALRGLGVTEEMRDVEPRPVQAREIERPKLILPGEENLPVPVLAESPETQSKASDTSGGEARESIPAAGPVVPRISPDSRGGQNPSEEERDEEGNYLF